MIRKIKIDAEKCDGSALCVNACSEGAIAIVDGEAAAYDEAAANGLRNAAAGQIPCGCPGAQAMAAGHAPPERYCTPEQCYASGQCCASARSELKQWPIQIKLAPINAPYFDGAHLLIAADCAAYAYGDFHSRYMKDRITLIGCPKLDNADYSEKLAEIMANNKIESVTIARMEVPCCVGIEDAVISAMHKSGKFVPWQLVILTIDGESVEA